jgi:hydroxyacylglutathione hydrolase
VWTPSADPQRFKDSTDVAAPQSQIEVGPIQWTVLPLPGHTHDHVGYWDAANKRLFCGDTLFNIGCGRIFDGSLKTLWQSLQTMAQLPPDTWIYCAHEYTLDNIAFAQQHVPTLELDSYAKQMEALREKGLPTIPFELSTNLQRNPFLSAPDYETFAARRKAKDQA